MLFLKCYSYQFSSETTKKNSESEVDINSTNKKTFFTSPPSSIMVNYNKNCYFFNKKV